MTDPYKVLGISRNASDEEVKKAYRTLSRRYHPDANINNPNAHYAEEKFKESQQAYQQIMQEREQGFRGNAYGAFGGYHDGTSSNTYSVHMAAALNYVRSMHYNEALNVLEGISERTAQWYHLSSVANSGLGNNVKAMEHIRTAVRMEPGNPEYQNWLRQLESGRVWYQEMRSPYGEMNQDGSGFCLKLCIANMICNLCLGGGACCGNNTPTGGL